MVPQRDAVVPAGITFGLVSDRGRRPSHRARVDRRADLCTRSGALAAGMVGLLADHALGGAIVPAMGDGHVMVTSHMHFELIRPITADIGRLQATGELVHVDAGSAFTRGDITDGDGVLVAHTSGRFALLPVQASASGAVRSAPPSTSEAPPRPRPAHPAADPIDDLLGLRVAPASSSTVEARFVAGGALANERRGLHGGVGILVAERTIDAAVRAATPAANEFRPVELRTLFLRPVAADDAELVCRAEVTHAGRSVIACTAILFTAEGKPSVTVDMIHALARP